MIDENLVDNITCIISFISRVKFHAFVESHPFYLI